MSTYEILTIIISSIMAVTSIISCIVSLNAKKETLTEKKEIAKMISDFKIEQNINDNRVTNSGTNSGVMASHISGGVKIGPRK